MKNAFALALVATAATAASANVVVNEVVGSTTGPDPEFIELYNTGAGAVDLTGWQIELWDSDSDAGGSGFGGADGTAPYALSGSIAAGGFWTIANGEAASQLGFVGDAFFGNNSIENSSYTLILRNDLGDIVNSIFFWDSGAGDQANDAGTIITPDLTVGPDGTFLAPGFYRVGDGSSTIAQHDFSDFTDYTPGAANVPAPAGLAVAGLGLLAAGRRRR
ncbi:lamin tail domain-containing protein [Marivita sp.]|uniref:lamin tail domain-containing protein n=1 Tax=Marivita sp. TaxID=2003365 RepID=UPI003B5CCD93